MKIRNTILYIVVLSGIASLILSCSNRPSLEDANYAETYTSYSLKKLVAPSFYFDALAFYKNGEPRIDIYLKVGYDKLIFMKEQEGSAAKYLCRIIIINEDNDSILVNNEFEKQVEKESGIEDYSNYFDYTLKSYKLPKGSFIISVKISDLNSTKFFSKLSRVVIEPSGVSDIQSSDILLIHKVNMENGQIKITPIISKHIPQMKKDTLYSFFELYALERKKVRIETNLVQLSFAYENDNEFIGSYRHFDNYYNKPWEVSNYKSIFRSSVDTVLTAKANSFILPVVIGSKPGNYLLYYKIQSNGKDSIIKYVRFSVLPQGFPKVTGIDDKIEVSKLARQPGEQDFFPANMTEKQKYEKFDEFWSQSSTWNREEFFKRAEVANERFSSFIEGWKTPMGKVYMICGEPDLIDSDKWVYQDYIIFDFAIIRDRSRYEVEEPMVILRWYSDNTYNFWRRMIDKIRTQ